MTRPTPLRMAIVEQGLSQREVAARAGIHEGQLSRIVNGLHAPDATRAKIAKAVRRPVSELWPDETSAAA